MDEATIGNTDIFNPACIHKEWVHTATQFQINTFLHRGLIALREDYHCFKQAQGQVNETLRTNITSLEGRYLDLQGNQANVDTLIAELQKRLESEVQNNVTFRGGVDATLDLYRQSINTLSNGVDALTIAKEDLYNQINALKGSIDIDKINAAIAGYQSTLASSKRYTDERFNALNDVVSANKAELETIVKSYSAKVDAYRADLNADFSDFKISISERLERVSNTLNLALTASDKLYQAQRDYVNTELANVSKIIAVLQTSVENMRGNLTALQARYDNALDIEAQTRSDADKRLDAKIEQLSLDAKRWVENVSNGSTADLTALETKLRGEINVAAVQAGDDNDALEARLTKVIQVETQARIEGDGANDGRVKAVEVALETADKTNKAAREAMYKQLSGEIDTTAENVSKDCKDYADKKVKVVQDDLTDAKEKLTNAIEKVRVNGESALAAEKEARENEYNALNKAFNNYDTNMRKALDKEIADRIAGDGENAGLIKSIETDFNRHLLEGVTAAKAYTDEEISKLDKKFTESQKKQDDDFQEEINNVEASMYENVNSKVEYLTKLIDENSDNIQGAREYTKAVEDNVKSIETKADDAVATVEANLGYVSQVGEIVIEDAVVEEVEKTIEYRGIRVTVSTAATSKAAVLVKLEMLDGEKTDICGYGRGLNRTTAVTSTFPTTGTGQSITRNAYQTYIRWELMDETGKAPIQVYAIYNPNAGKFYLRVFG